MEQLDSRFIELLQDLGKNSGLDSLSSTILAILYVQPEEIAMDSIAEQTGYSLASISNKSSMLISLGLIIKKKKPGTKKIFLFMEKDFLKLFKDELLRKKQLNIIIAKEKVPSIIKEFKSKAKTMADKEKLKIIEDYYSKVLLFEKVINEMVQRIDTIK